jgi:hypothetical protein
MKPHVIRALAVTAGSLLAATSALAHVGYGNALFIQAGGVDPIGTALTAGNVFPTDTFGAASNFTSTVSSNAGYITGLDPVTYGNTHDIRFRYFVLAQPSQVGFKITGLSNSPVTGNANPALNGMTPSTLNPAFSLYRGIVPPSSHDGVGENPAYAADPDIRALLQSEGGFAPWSPFVGTNAAIDAAKGLPPGTTSASAAATHWGVFRTNADFATGNDGVSPGGATYSYQYANGDNTPTAGTIQYTGISFADALVGATYTDSQGVSHTVLGADGALDNVVSWSGVLGPGVYTLAIGGAGLIDYANLYTAVRFSNAGRSTDVTANTAYAADRLARRLTITEFTVTAVPEPASIWMLGGGLALLGFYAARRRRGLG